MTKAAKILFVVAASIAGIVGLAKAWQVFGHKKKKPKVYKALGVWSEDRHTYTDGSKRGWYLTGIPGKVALGGTGAYVETDLTADFKKAQKPGSVAYAMLWDGQKSPHSDEEWNAMKMASFSASENDYEFLGQEMDEETLA